MILLKWKDCGSLYFCLKFHLIHSKSQCLHNGLWVSSIDLIFPYFSELISYSLQLYWLLAVPWTFWIHTCLRVFALTVPPAWNALPTDVYRINLFTSFKLLFKWHFLNEVSPEYCIQNCSYLLHTHLLFFAWFYILFSPKTYLEFYIVHLFIMFIFVSFPERV